MICEIPVKVSFLNHTLTKKDSGVVEGDYNTTKLIFEFEEDVTDKRIVFKMSNPDGEPVLVQDLVDNEITLAGFDEEGKVYSLFNEAGLYAFELVLYNNSGKLTSAPGWLTASKRQVTLEGGGVVEAYLPVLEEMLTLDTAVKALQEDAEKYFPAVIPMCTTQSNLAAECGGLLANISDNVIMSISTAQGWTDMPIPRNSIFIHQRYGSNYSIQRIYPMNLIPDTTYPINTPNLMYTRLINHTNHTVYTPWDFDNTIKMQTKQSSLSPACGKLLSNITENVVFSCSSSQWTDMPTTAGGVFTNQRYGTNFNLQIFTEVTSGIQWNRIIKRTDNSVYRGWKKASADIAKENLKILALGDSICYGARNSNKGFVGDLGYSYQNIGKSSATLSDFSAGRTEPVTPIPNQLIEFAEANPDYKPDIIIANGGVNDYYQNVLLGELGERNGTEELTITPVISDAGATGLNKATAIGGLEYLFYKMIELYPNARRAFLITHKTYATAYAGADEKRYWVGTKNVASVPYTQQEMHDAIVECCKRYNVEIIDVYEESMIDTLHSAYRSDVSYNTDNSITNTEYVDADGIHPCALGYLKGYVPIIRKALNI